jgi:hypothetical protein
VRGFLRFLALFAVLAAVLVLIVLPLVAGPVLTGMVRDMGLRSESLQVSVALFDPTLLLGQSRSLHLSAGDVDVAPATVGSIDLTLGGVSLFDRNWRTVQGEMHDVSVTTGGETFTVDELTVSGPAESASATARLNAAETESLIRFAAEREGLQLDDVQVSNDGVTVTSHGTQTEAQLVVRGGALVLLPGTGTGGVALIQPAPSDAWRLEEAWISDEGLNVRGVVDTTVLANEVGG